MPVALNHELLQLSGFVFDVGFSVCKHTEYPIAYHLQDQAAIMGSIEIPIKSVHKMQDLLQVFGWDLYNNAGQYYKWIGIVKNADSREERRRE
jgi:hypothetical protein